MSLSAWPRRLTYDLRSGKATCTNCTGGFFGVAKALVSLRLKQPLSIEETQTRPGDPAQFSPVEVQCRALYLVQIQPRTIHGPHNRSRANAGHVFRPNSLPLQNLQHAQMSSSPHRAPAQSQSDPFSLSFFRQNMEPPPTPVASVDPNSEAERAPTPADRRHGSTCPALGPWAQGPGGRPSTGHCPVRSVQGRLCWRFWIY